MAETYPRPPITEGIIEVRWSTLLPESVLQKARQIARTRFSTEEEEVDVEVRFEGADPIVKQLGAGSYRFRSEDSTEILIIKKNALVVSRLAPYTGWASLSGRWRDEFERLRKAGGRVTSRARIGVRFINRIDIPTFGNGFDPGDYILGYPVTPSIFTGPIGVFASQVGGAPIGDYLANLNVSKQPSPILNHVGLLLDIDVYNDMEAPIGRIEEELVAIHDIKNAIFEGMITDKARALFR